MKFSLKLLDSLAGNYTKVLVFDCEFWHVLKNINETTISSSDTFFFVPREIGGFLLEKKGTQWKLNKTFFVTLGKPSRETVLPVSKFSTVTPQTAYKLDAIEKRLGLPWGEAFPSRLSNEGKQAYAEGLIIYNSDENIEKSHKSPSWYKKFMEVYSESLIIVKGLGDINSLKNASLIYNFQYKNPLDIIDIAEWNEESTRLCETAKLEGSYNCIKKKLDKETKTIADFLPLEKAHDPSTDASMTLLVALYIQSQKP